MRDRRLGSDFSWPGELKGFVMECADRLEFRRLGSC
jgi:hypothetical protein